ncbi:MAG: universal stress protein [Flavobacterium psychrophilum]
MKKILFPTDFSSASQHAFRYALRLAHDRNAEIITVHAYDLPQVDYANYPIPLTIIYQVNDLGNFENYKQHIPILHEIAKSIGLEHIKLSNVLECGNLMDILTKLCKTEQVDCIVMGTKGTSGIVETFLGSVTSKVMHEIPVPVFAIPEFAQFNSIKNMLFITRYDSTDKAILQQALKMANHFSGTLHCLHVGDLLVDQRNQKKWEHQFPTVSFTNLKTDLDIESHILEYIGQHSFDLLVMPIHHKTRFERIFQRSLSKRLSMHVSIPILSLPN